MTWKWFKITINVTCDYIIRLCKFTFFSHHLWAKTNVGRFLKIFVITFYTVLFDTPWVFQFKSSVVMFSSQTNVKKNSFGRSQGVEQCLASTKKETVNLTLDFAFAKYIELIIHIWREAHLYTVSMLHLCMSAFAWRGREKEACQSESWWAVCAESRERRRERERGRWGLDASERASQTECFSLSLATVGGGRLQPVVFAPSSCHAHTPLTHPLLLWLLCSLVCLLDPRVSFDVFFQMIFFRYFLWDEGSFLRISR